MIGFDVGDMLGFDASQSPDKDRPAVSNVVGDVKWICVIGDDVRWIGVVGDNAPLISPWEWWCRDGLDVHTNANANAAALGLDVDGDKLEAPLAAVAVDTPQEACERACIGVPGLLWPFSLAPKGLGVWALGRRAP